MPGGKFSMALPGEEELDEINENFDHFDSDKNGLLNYQEFTYLVDAMGGDMSPDEMHAGFSYIDTDQNGYIDIEEFIQWWSEQ